MASVKAVTGQGHGSPDGIVRLVLSQVSTSAADAVDGAPGGLTSWVTFRKS
jgi:hypothetical protein